jgi:hypothetical protein
MNLIKRTCANCIAFEPAPGELAPTCGYMVTMLVHHVDRHGTPMVVRRQPYSGFCCDGHHTPEENTAQAQLGEAARQMAEATPECMAAMIAWVQLVKTLGHYHPDTVQAQELIAPLAPPSMRASMVETSETPSLGLDACARTDHGEQVISLQAIAEKLGIGMDEAQDELEAMLADRAKRGLPAGLVDLATVHFKQ